MVVCAAIKVWCMPADCATQDNQWQRIIGTQLHYCFLLAVLFQLNFFALIQYVNITTLWIITHLVSCVVMYCHVPKFQWSIKCNLDESNMNFPSNLKCTWKIISKMCPSHEMVAYQTDTAGLFWASPLTCWMVMAVKYMTEKLLLLIKIFHHNSKPIWIMNMNKIKQTGKYFAAIVT